MIRLPHDGELFISCYDGVDPAIAAADKVKREAIRNVMAMSEVIAQLGVTAEEAGEALIWFGNLPVRSIRDPAASARERSKADVERKRRERRRNRK